MSATESLIERLKKDAEHLNITKQFGWFTIGADILEAAAELEAIRSRCERMEEEVKRLKTPDQFWDWSDPECGYADISEAVSNANMGDVVRLLTGRTLGDVWATIRVLTVDEHGDWDDHEIACFDNPIDAAKCWPESLSAARALQQGGKADG